MSVEERVIEIVSEQMGVAKDQVTRETSLRQRPRGRLARYRRVGDGVRRRVRHHHPRRGGGEDPDRRAGDRIYRGTHEVNVARPRRVVITGMGVVTALGETLESFWSGLFEGRSGVGPMDVFDTTEFKVHFGGQVQGWDAGASVRHKTARRLDRFAQFAMVASIEAVKETGIDFPA